MFHNICLNVRQGFLIPKKKKRTATGCKFPLGDMKINVYTGSSRKVQHCIGGMVKIYLSEVVIIYLVLVLLILVDLALALQIYQLY